MRDLETLTIGKTFREVGRSTWLAEGGSFGRHIREGVISTLRLWTMAVPGPVGKRVFFRAGEERLIHYVRRSSLLSAVTGAGNTIEDRPFGLLGQADRPAPGR